MHDSNRRCRTQPLRSVCAACCGKTRRPSPLTPTSSCTWMVCASLWGLRWVATAVHLRTAQLGAGECPPAHLMWLVCRVTAGTKQHLGQRPEGRFVVGGDEYAAALRDLPTIVETYKTYDDVNMVKCTDIGQVRPRSSRQPGLGERMLSG